MTSSDSQSSERPYALDKAAIRQAFDAAARHYDQTAVIPQEIGRRMLERLDFIKLQPTVIADIGCGTGFHTTALHKKYASAYCIALDLAPLLLRRARKRCGTGTWPFTRPKIGYLCADVEQLPLRDASCDLVFTNNVLEWCDLESALHAFRRILKPNGLLMFSTLGPDTLMELRRSWAQADSAHPDAHIHAFIDMHDIGDALMRHGFTDPVMDTERLTVTYPDLRKLLRDLKMQGAHNALCKRRRGLTGIKYFQHLNQAYEQFRRSDGLLPASCEVVYGHAWAPTHLHSSPRRVGTATFPVDQLRRRNRT